MRRLALLLLLVAAAGRAQEPGETCTTVVRDARTGAPLPGVRVCRYEEDARDSFVRARLLAEAVTDERGVASIPLGDRAEDCHWVFDKPGHAVRECYGVVPSEVADLDPGGVLRGRLLDPFGAPCAGVALEALLGCGHSPAVRRTRTDADGRFAFEDVDPPVRVWFQDAGLAATYLELTDAAAAPVFFADPGVTVTGQVVGRDGRPVKGAVLRTFQQYRGPTAVTDADGRFRLTGVAPGEDLRAWGPGGGYADVDGTAYEPGRDLRIRLGTSGEDDQWGRTDPGAEDLPFRVLVLDGDAPVGGVPAVLCRLADGRAFRGATGEDGLAEIEAPAGEYALRVGDATSSHVARADRVVASGDEGVLRVAAVRQPLLEIETAGLTADVRVDLVLATQLWPLDRKSGYRTHLPPEEPATVRVTGDEEVRVFPVGPLRDGKRRARLE